MANKQLIIPGNRAFNSNGLAIPGATASLYTTGTTTPANFYADSGLITSLGTTLTANGIGRFTTAYQNEATPFRLILRDATGATLDGGDIDPFYFGASTDAAVAAASAATSATAAATSATNAATSATSAATSATTATTQAGNAATSATASAASAATATTQAGLATTNGAAQVALATTQATNAATSATNAAASAVTAAAQVAGLAPTKLNEEMFGEINIFDKSTITLNSVLISGVLTTNAGAWGNYYASDFMPVDGAGSVTFSHAQTGLDTAHSAAWYDASKTYISSFNTAAGTSYTAPNNARYVRWDVDKRLVSAADVMISPGTALPSVYRPFGLLNSVVQRAQMQALDVAHQRTRSGLYDPDTTSANTILTSGTGATSTFSNISTSGYMPVTAGGTITITVAVSGIGNPYGCAFYDENKVYISGINGPFTAGQVISVPSTALYFRIALTTNVLSTFNVLEGTQTPLSPAKHRRAFVNDAQQWADLKIGFLGDSITAQGNMPLDVATALGATSTVFAFAGRKMQDALCTSASLNGTAMVQADVTPLDAVMIFLGTNDYNAGTTLGTVADSTATATFAGYTKKAIEQLLTWKPTLRIFIATLLQRNGSNADPTFAPYSAMLRSVANLYALPIVELERESGVNATTMSTALADGLHPNTVGYNSFVSPCVAGKFNAFFSSVPIL